MRTTTPDRPAVGIRKTPQGHQAYVTIDGAFHSKRFPPETALSAMVDWREKAKARATLNLPREADTGPTFEQDCTEYLKAVATMPTFSDRQHRIHLWRDALGPSRSRKTITSVEIRQQLERWRLANKKPGTLNLLRTALMHLYAVLDGRAAPNPVKDVPRYREIPPALQLPTIADAEKAIAAVRSDRKVSATRSRLQVLLWTGWPSAQLKLLTKADVDFKKARAFVRGRRKGRGTRDRWLPLLPQAVKALKAFKRADAWGSFSGSSLHSSLGRGCLAAGVRPFRVYDLRHLFLSTVAAATKDDRVVAELAQHSDLRMTRRYTEQSVDPRLVEGLAAVTTFLAPPPKKGARVAGVAGSGVRSRRSASGCKPAKMTIPGKRAIVKTPAKSLRKKVGGR